MKLTNEERIKIDSIGSDLTSDGKASMPLQALILQVLLSIDARLEDTNFYLQNQEERAHNQ